MKEIRLMDTGRTGYEIQLALAERYKDPKWVSEHLRCVEGVWCMDFHGTEFQDWVQKLFRTVRAMLPTPFMFGTKKEDVVASIVAKNMEARVR